MTYIRDNYDVIVVGGGHAGCEAALAAARLNKKTLLLAISLDSIALMPCNPSIGGTSKGHLVREIDALGGQMAKNIDKTFLQSKMLNKSKGPAVYSLRAQADKYKYSREMKITLEKCENLHLIQGEAKDLIIENGEIKAVVITSGAVFNAKAVILATGTYMKSRCLYGSTIIESGPNGLKNSRLLSARLINNGIKLMRFKTGTPARIDKTTIDFSKLTIQHGDDDIVPFSFETDANAIKREQLPCYMAYTNSATHEVILKNIDRSPLYAGVIEGAPTRYCPSIEDKVMRFKDKDRHQLFVEPEGEHTNEVYIQGMSSSLPEDVQIAFYRSIEGFENCHITRPAYAIEYDVIDATQLKLSLEFKNIAGLFSAGQLNGSSGYEEAAAQGIIAGVNAVKYLNGDEPLILDRSEAYIGVLIDDLVTKGSAEPYRMMTSRAEYRLLLRQDNADLRLREIGYLCGLVPQHVYDSFLVKKSLIESEINRLKATVVPPSENVNGFLSKVGSAQITTGVKMYDLIKRPEITYALLVQIDEARPNLPNDVSEQVNISIKYEGYIKMQAEQAAAFKKMEKKLLPDNFDYNAVSGLSAESKQKLNDLKPRSIGQAGRISGVSPADISVLLVHLKKAESL